MQPPTPRPRESAIANLIRAAADRHNVPRQVALAFAWCESRHDPTAQGDLKWHEKKAGTLYRRHVLEQPRFDGNPARSSPDLWHSYGLFQLLACYYAADDEHPHALLNPAINADRGCRIIARHLKHAHGDARCARLAYVGCGYDGHLCADRAVSQICEALQLAMARYGNEAAAPRA